MHALCPSSGFLRKHRGSVILLAALIAALLTPTIARGQPIQKWLQHPDDTSLGIDVSATEPYLLADDYQCTATGAVTEITVWGSWRSDYYPFGGDPGGVRFTLSLHADIPAWQSPTGYSMPGELLWIRSFEPGTFGFEPFFQGIPEGWMDPPASYVFPGDFNCWRYVFPIPAADAFVQTGTPAEPVVYWLDVQAVPLDPSAFFGWKTSQAHWNDDAVWGQGVEPYSGLWNELRYPPPHEQAGQSIDLAFAITTEPVQQEMDFGDAPDQPYPTFLASNGARHVIVPGILLGNLIDAEPDGQPDPNALGDDTGNLPDEDGVQILTPMIPGSGGTIQVTPSVPAYIDVWIDWKQDGSWAEAGDYVFSAVLPAGPQPIAIAVPPYATPGTAFMRVRMNTLGPLSYDGPAIDGEVEDHRVLIEEDVTYKWIQRPDLGETGIDVNATQPFLLADDFLCTEAGAITEIHVWGSWLNDAFCPVTFTLSFHADIPASPNNHSMPGEVLWIRQFPPGSYEERLYAQGILEGFMTPPDFYLFPGDTQCWEYVFHVPFPEAFLQQGSPDDPVVYWLDVQASPEVDFTFGWKTSLDHWNDDAVWGMGMEPYPGPWQELRYPPGHPFHPESIDLAFALRSEPMPEEYDFGDAPDPTYPTLHASGGAYHTIVPNVFLGLQVDGEPDGQPDPFATGDDLAGADDEDGLVGAGVMVVGQPYPLNVTASTQGWLDMWIDFGQDGGWADAQDHCFSGPIPAGTGVQVVTAPANALAGGTYARVRFSTTGPMPFGGHWPDGEVEDYLVYIAEADFGDAPDGAAAPGYPTLLANNGAHHLISPGVYLGNAIDREPDGQPDAFATGDDLAGADDEDGVTFMSAVVPGGTAWVQVAASVAGWIDVWYDFNANGSWSDAGEAVFSGSVSAGVNGITFGVPANATPGPTFARYRFGTQGPIPVGGQWPDGEVEDYQVVIESPAELKWEQPPDLTPEGIDVSASPPYILADDFLCDQPGRLVEIRVWGSWLNDHLPFGQDPLAMDFFLSIHEDIPAEASGTGYSMPGEMVWFRAFPAASFTAEPLPVVLDEGFLWPPEEYIFPGDHTCWLYTFRIPEEEAFLQQGNPDFPRIYWLDVKAVPHDAAAVWGWKTSMQHWNDDAVWGQGDEPYPGPWFELRYPPPHPLHPESIDLAFALYQLPEPYEPDFGDAPGVTGGPAYPTLLAQNGARHVIVPGVLLGAQIDGEPDGQPHPAALGDDLALLDDEDGVVFTSVIRAGWVATWSVAASVAGHLDVWLDWNGNWSWADPGEHITSGWINAGVNLFSWHVPITAQPGTSFMRFRFTTTGPLNYFGAASDGEVEDYEVQILETTAAPDPAAPKAFRLLPAAPNPITAGTTVAFDLPEESPVRIEVFSAEGRKVATLLDEARPAGHHALTWDGRDAEGRDAAAGIYFLHMRSGAFEQTQRLVILR